ncbi:hypothetical protein GALMADRAFT_233681 [Galerina marginata CBS 339.88]|uniref:Pre-rRNA-processing protein n=1 Tax=Galerina marginata (strain CBS 339.88) TaxID=685588 RepID=A0A067TPI2_GALM3|nr:hypothetical protein GALMADRAFT_233681 [Galerina marginata CBS 339.88]
MPKSSKKKKDKVADFSKAKLKLGKGKAPATNAIDTSFKARSIALPSQSIAFEKNTSEPITRRQLTFGDLISHLKHYNVGTRKDAILGLRELLDANWGLLDSCLAPLVNALVRLIGDEDASVRKQLLSFLAWMLPRIPLEDLIPHAPLLLLFTTSAQTHIFAEIRIDAVRFLDVLLDCIPESVIAGWCEMTDGHGSRVLGGYLGILNAGTKYGETEGPLKATSTASVVLTPASKLVVLRSLSTFLRTALSPSDSIPKKGRLPPNTNTPLDAVFMKNAFPSSHAYLSFESLFKTSDQTGNGNTFFRNWQPEMPADDELGDIFIQYFPLLNSFGDAWTLHDLATSQSFSGAKANIHTSPLANVDFVAHLAGTLHSTIIETYLDCAPSVFSPGSSPPETEVQLIVTIAQLAQSLYHVVLESPENIDNEHVEHLESIVNYMSPYFPASTRDGKLEQAYEEFNLIFCELTSLAVNASQSGSSRSHQKRKARGRTTATQLSGSRVKASIQTERVTQYITRRLRGEAASSDHIGVAINPTAYRALLPTIWALISSGGAKAEEANEVIHATLDHALKVSSKSACKRLTVEFVGRLVLLGLERHYLGGVLDSDKNPAVKAKFDAWVWHLPQVVWELGSANLHSTETILRVVLRVLQRQSKTVRSETAASFQSRLVPYFYIDHPNRGPLPGPYKKLPPSSGSKIRILVLDVAATVLDLGRQNGQEFESLSRAVGLAVAGEEEESYWSHVSAARFINKL